jgi:hypothetical protein
MNTFVTVCVKHFLFFIFFHLCVIKTSFSDEDKKSEAHLKIFEISPIDLNFAFEKDTLLLIDSEEGLENFWKEHSRNIDPQAPKISIDWKKENLILYFWKSVDDLKRLSAVGSFRFDDDKIFIHAALANMCFAIITDISPALFLGISKNKIKEVSQIKLETSFLKEICL